MAADLGEDELAVGRYGRRKPARIECLDFGFEFAQRGNFGLDLGLGAGRQLGIVLVEAGGGGLDGIETEDGFVEIAVRQAGESGVTALGEAGRGQQKEGEKPHLFIMAAGWMQAGHARSPQIVETHTGSVRRFSHIGPLHAPEPPIFGLH